MQVDFTQRRYSYKLLLYADNRSHMSCLRLIKREFPDFYVGCWHVEHDEQGREIVTGAGKKHCHVLLKFPNARSYGSVCRSLGFVHGIDIDNQCVHPIGYKDDGSRVKWETWEKGLAYLTHANSPDKPQIAPDKVFGAKQLIIQASIAAERERAQSSSQSVCVWHIKDWICKHTGIVSYAMLTDYLCDNPYFKGASSRLVYGVLEEHNQKIREQIAREKGWAFADAVGTDYGQSQEGISRSSFNGFGHPEDDGWMFDSLDDLLF